MLTLRPTFVARLSFRLAAGYLLMAASAYAATLAGLTVTFAGLGKLKLTLPL